MAYDTATNIINDVAVELGLLSFQSKVADPFASTDPNLGQLCQLLKSVGRELFRLRQWSNLRQAHTFMTAANLGTYSLPADFDRVIDSTAWNRTNRLPLGGPMTPQQLEFLRARLVGIAWNVLWTVLQGQFLAYPDTTTPGNYLLAYEYVSRWWVVPAATQAPTAGMYRSGVQYYRSIPPGVSYVQSAGNIYACTTTGVAGGLGNPIGTGTFNDGVCTWQYISAAGTDAPAAKDDVIQFDPQLVVRALKLRFLEAKGFDSQAARDDFEEALEQAISADVQAPTLDFTHNSFSEPMLGPWNLPLNGQ